MIQVYLPLPPSKNKTRTIKHNSVLQTSAVKQYRKEVYEIIVMESPEVRKYLTENDKNDRTLVVSCYWYVKNKLQDVVNFHDELADAIEFASGINDRRYLMRDISKRIDSKNPRVEVCMHYES